MDLEILKDLARHQRWADAEHWKAIHQNPSLSNDKDVRHRLNHMLMAYRALCGLARGEPPPVPGTFTDPDSMQALEAAMQDAAEGMEQMLATSDLEKSIAIPRGPKGPFNAPVGVLLLQAIMHNQHHRGQNTARMRELGATPPMTDFVVWYALGKP